jgi:ubiquinone/menaquinone biosynthesis C-methylase UbiE
MWQWLQTTGVRLASPTDTAHSFEDSAPYVRFIGTWGRAAGATFLDWLAPPAGAHWLDIGCGTGLFTELIFDMRSPATAVAIDAAAAQIEHARRKPVARRASFQVGDAQTLPFPDSSFDVVVSALAINFIPDRPRALSEMRRVARPDGVVAGYIWDIAEELSPSGPFRLGLRDVVANLPALPGTEESSFSALRSLFAHARLEDIATRTIDVTVSFPNFDDFWRAQTPSYSPMTKMVAAMTASERAKLANAVRAHVQLRQDGRVEYPARANAIKACVPGR